MLSTDFMFKQQETSGWIQAAMQQNTIFGGRESLIFSLVTSSSFFFKSKSGERKEQITIFLTASIYWLIGSQNVAPKGETTDSSKSKTDNTTL